MELISSTTQKNNTYKELVSMEKVAYDKEEEEV